VDNHDYSEAIRFLALLFADSEGAVEIRALPQERDAGPSRPVFTRNSAIVLTHLKRWDGPGRAVYVGAGTRILGRGSGRREDVHQITALWSDIDCSKIGVSKEEAVAALRPIPIPPSLIVDSGHGIHPWWLLKEPIDVRATDPATAANESSIVLALRQLASVVGGDPAVCDLARVMRLPGTHNCKGGELRLTSVLWEVSTQRRHDFSEILDALDYLAPVIVPKTVEATVVKLPDDDPYVILARRYVGAAPVDVAARIEAMTYQGDGDRGIHRTQLSVSASLIGHGASDDEVVEALLAATHVAAGGAGSAWNWTREEAAIRKMCAAWRARLDREAKEGRPQLRLVQRAQAKADADADADPDNHPQSDPPASPAGRPIIRIVAGTLHLQATAAERVLHESGAPFYTRGGRIMRPVIEDVPAARGLRTKIARLHEVTVTGMTDWLSRVANFVRLDKREKKWVASNPPDDVAAIVLSRDGEWILDPVTAVITTPTLRPDGSLLTAPGYDPQTRLLLVDPPALPAMPVAPSRSDGLVALDLLLGLLAEFSFVDEPSRAVAVSGLITAVVRGSLTSAPMHAFRAPAAGSGKSYFADLAAAIAIGQRCPVISAGKTEEELEKRLASALIAAQPIVSIDNVNGELRGDALCQMVERPIVRIRPLGRSELVQIETKCAVFANGNNMTICGDLTRRTLTATLDAGIERPELKQYSDAPFDRILADRGAFVAAALIVVLSYRTAGSPGLLPRLASYEEWSDLIRSALVWLGMADPVETIDTARDEDPDLAELRNVIVGWEEAIGTNIELGPGEIVAIAEKQEYEVSDDPYQRSSAKGYLHPEFRQALLEVAHDPKAIDPRRLAHWLIRRKGRIVDGFRVVGRLDGHTKRWRWKLQRAGGPVRDPMEPPF